MNEVILNGVSSNTINGLLIQELPPVSKPLIRATVEEIDGRDGDIITKLGYSAYDKAMLIGLYGNFDIDEVIEFFNSSGKVTFSNEPDKYYNYEILEQIDFERLIRFRRAEVVFHVQPFKYLVDEEQIQVDTTMITAEGSNNMTLEYTQGGATLQIDLKGNTAQDGTPTPSAPIAVQSVSGDNVITVCGKNMLDTSQASNTTIRGIAFTRNSDGSITAKGTSSGGNVSYTIYSMGTTNGIKLESGKTYVFSGANFQLNGAIGKSAISYPQVYTAQYGDYISLVWLWYADGTTIDKTYYPQLEVGSTVTEYQPYQEQEYPITLPVENLVENSLVTSTPGSGISIVVDNGTIAFSGTATSTKWLTVCKKTLAEYGLSVGDTVTLSGCPQGGATDKYYMRGFLHDSNGADLSSYLIDTGSGGSLTLPSNTADIEVTIYVANGQNMDNLVFMPQLEKGSKANTYQPYGTTPIELNKIGSYADYFVKKNGSWYVHKETRNYTITSSSGAYSSVGTGFFGGYYSMSSLMPNLRTLGYCKELPPIASPSQATQEGITFGAGTNNKTVYFVLNASRLTESSKAGIDSWLSANPLHIMYVLQTPTEVEVTDTTLISQLNAISQAMSYNGVTNILQDNNDLPFWLDVEAYGNVNSHILNDGNYTARPLLTIYGTGNIGVYLNEIQVFQIEMGDNDKIAIDSAKMEAYDPDTKALLNRLVTGDYSNFVLKKGQNELVFSGSVQGFTLDNYTRWL